MTFRVTLKSLLKFLCNHFQIYFAITFKVTLQSLLKSFCNHFQSYFTITFKVSLHSFFNYFEITNMNGYNVFFKTQKQCLQAFFANINNDFYILQTVFISSFSRDSFLLSISKSYLLRRILNSTHSLMHLVHQI